MIGVGLKEADKHNSSDKLNIFKVVYYPVCSSNPPTKFPPSRPSVTAGVLPAPRWRLFISTSLMSCSLSICEGLLSQPTPTVNYPPWLWASKTPTHLGQMGIWIVTLRKMNKKKQKIMKSTELWGSPRGRAAHWSVCICQKIRLNEWWEDSKEKERKLWKQLVKIMHPQWCKRVSIL